MGKSPKTASTRRGKRQRSPYALRSGRGQPLTSPDSNALAPARRPRQQESTNTDMEVEAANIVPSQEILPAPEQDEMDIEDKTIEIIYEEIEDGNEKS